MPKFKFIAAMVPEIQAFKNENLEIARKYPFSQILSQFVILFTHIHVDLTITTKKLTELFSTMNDGGVDHLRLLLYLSVIKTDKVIRSFHSPFQRKEAYLDLYATDHPCPSWKQIAQALRVVGLFSEADMVENTYVQGRLSTS